MYLLILRFVC